MTFTPRFGEITNYDEVITEIVCNNIKDEMKLDKNVWFILYKRHMYYKCEMTGSYYSPLPYYKIYLIDNYLNKYLVDVKAYCPYNSPNTFNLLNDINKTYKTSDKRFYIEAVIKELIVNCKYDTPLSDEEITYIRDYCNKDDFEDMTILKNRMKSYITLQNTLNNYETNVTELERNYNTLLNNNKLLQKSLEEKFITLLKQNEALLETNKQYKSSIQELNTKIVELEKLQKEDSTFMSYLKNLVVWK